MKVVLSTKRDYPQLKRLRSELDVSSDGEICVAIGGDGTFINAIKEFDLPTLPVRDGEAGSTGYYSDVSLKDIDFIIKSLKDGKFSIEKVGRKLEITLKNKRYYALNECCINSSPQEVYLKVSVSNDGTAHAVYPYVISGDGLLICNNIGSTAYNRSANGPIILDKNVMCMNLLNTESPIRSPIVFDDSHWISVEVVKGKGGLSYDGDKISELKIGGTFKVSLSSKPIEIVRFDERREHLHNKLARIVTSKMLTELGPKD